MHAAVVGRYGYWDEHVPVKVNGGGGSVLATAFVRRGSTTYIPIANFARHPGTPYIAGIDLFCICRRVLPTNWCLIGKRFLCLALSMT